MPKNCHFSKKLSMPIWSYLSLTVETGRERVVMLLFIKTNKWIFEYTCNEIKTECVS